MIEQLQHRAEAIKMAIKQHPERGADLLIDFARAYAGSVDAEDEVILKKLEWMMAPNEQEKATAKLDLLALTDKIAADYNPEAVKAFAEKEQQVAKAAAKISLPNDVVLRAEHIKKRYRNSRFTLQAEHLELRLGEITGLVGENATGKTTLFRILAGDLAPDSGSVQYTLFDPKDRLHWPDLKRKIAYVPQELPVWLGSLRENIQFEAALHGIRGAANQQATDYIIHRMGLAPHLDKTWAELSGGYKLRFALAKAMVWKAQLLIVDEPLAFLDIKTQLVVLNDLKNLAKSLRYPIAILVSSQHLHEIEAVADQMLFMKDGYLEVLGRTADFGNDRSRNIFEIGSPLAFADFTKRLDDFHYHKTWSNGMTYFVSTPLETDGFALLQFLHQQQIPVQYFRDISRSVKTKFYADQL